MKKIYTVLLSLIILITMSINSNSQTLEVTGSLFLPQDSISFTYTDPAFTETDWIGIYRVDETPGGPASSSWNYVSGNSGTLNLAAPQVAGTYKAYLLCCDGYDIIATSSDFIVDVPYLITSFPSFVANEPMDFNFKSPRYTATDKIAIYTEGTKPGDANPAIASKYITMSAGTLTFDTDLLPGFYDAYLLCCDGFDSISACTFEVKDGSVAFISPKTMVFEAGSTLDFTYNDPSYADGDWIGIYNEYDDPTMVSSVTWSKLVSQSGVVSFPGVLAGGTYIAVLFCCGNTETEYTRSVVFEVASGEVGTYIKTAASVYPEGTTILVNYRDNDYTGTDWIGIYHKDDVPGSGTESLVWYYAPNDSGTMEFASTLSVGDYVVYLLCCDGYNIKARFSFKIVNESTSYLVSTKLVYGLGEGLEFTYNSPSFVDTDWIGVYYPGDIPGGNEVYSIIWKYLPDANGTMTFSYPDEHILSPGEYWAGLFCCDAYGLYAMSSFTISEFGVGLQPDVKTAKLNLFPNPTTGLFTIKMENGEKIERIVVYNITGQILYQEKPTGLINEKILDLKLNKGIYFLEIGTESSRMSKKLIIQ